MACTCPYPCHGSGTATVTVNDQTVSCECKVCPPCPCYSSVTWTSTVPQITSSFCPGGASVTIVNTLTTDGCCLEPIGDISNLGLAQFYMIKPGNVTLTNSIVNFTCGIFPGLWRVGLTGTYQIGNVTKYFDDCTVVSVNGGLSSSALCCPTSSTTVSSTNISLCGGSSFTRRQMLQMAVASRIRKIKY